MLLDLLEELQEKILNYCQVEALIHLSLCNSELKCLCEPYLWKNVKVPLRLLVREFMDETEYGRTMDHLRYTKCLRTIGVDVSSADLKHGLSNTQNIVAYCNDLRILHTWFLSPEVFEKWKCSKLREISLSRYAANDDTLEAVCSNLPQLQVLAIENGRHFSIRASVNISQLKMLQKLTIIYCNISFLKIDGVFSVKELTGSRCGVGDEDVQACSKSLVNLEKLVIYDSSRITDNAFSNIGDLIKLRELNVSALSIGDLAMKYIRGCQNLQVLEARETSMSNFGLASIAMINGLRKLDVSHSRISESGIAHLVGLNTLEVLYMNGCGGVDDNAINKMSSITSLKDVGLCGCHALTNGCVPYLLRLELLEKLDICGCRYITAYDHLARIEFLLR